MSKLQTIFPGSRPSALQRADDDVLAPFFPPLALVQHSKGFPHTGGISEKDLQFAAGMLLRLDPPQELVRIGTAVL